ncbi:hypothetical protein PMAYCL1PPCAC_04567, partial [Pristionchus mayeri]
MRYDRNCVDELLVVELTLVVAKFLKMLGSNATHLARAVEREASHLRLQCILGDFVYAVDHLRESRPRFRPTLHSRRLHAESVAQLAKARIIGLTQLGVDLHELVVLLLRQLPSLRELDQRGLQISIDLRGAHRVPLAVWIRAVGVARGLQHAQLCGRSHQIRLTLR